MKRVTITKPTGRKPMRIGALLLKEVPYQSEWRIQATWRDPDRKKKWFNNWRHAEEFAAKENKRLDELKEKGAGRYTFNDAADSYLKECERLSKAKENSGCTLDTFDLYQRRVENYLRPKFGHMRLTEISTQVISDWLIEQRSIAKPNTYRGRFATLKRVLNHAAQHDMLPVNPLKVRNIDRKLLGDVGKRAKIPDRSDLEKLREYINGPRPLGHSRITWSCTRMIVLLAVSCGMRAGECSALRWDDIDRDTGDITINKSRARKQGLKGPKTPAGERKILTTPRARQIIEEHAEVYKELFGKCVGPVLRSAEKEYLRANRISDIFREAMRTCDLVEPDTNKIKFSHHKSRHWAASHWMKSTKGDIHRVKTWLGHKNASMTLDIYGHVLDDPEAREKFMQMPDWLAPIVEIAAPSATRPIEITETPLALPAPEESFEFDSGVEVNGQLGSDCPIDVPSIAEPFVKPLIDLLYQGMPAMEAYCEIAPLITSERYKNKPLKLRQVRARVCEEFTRLKLPLPKTIERRLRAEKILELHAQKYQSLDIARIVGCSADYVNMVLRSRHKPNANNPLNRKINQYSPERGPTQFEHKTQLKLL